MVRSPLLTALSRLTLKRTSRGDKILRGPSKLSSVGTIRPQSSSLRFFSSDDKNKKDIDEDPFGVNFEDGTDHGKIGPTKHLPPKYKRDATTGRQTGEIEHELTEEEKRVLKADPIQLDKLLSKRVEEHWEASGEADEAGESSQLDKLGERIRTADMGLNVLGRSVQAQAAKEQLEDGSELGRDGSGFSQNLTADEFSAFSTYMKKKHDLNVMDNEIPVQARSRKKERKNPNDTESEEENPDSQRLALKWLSTRGQRQMDDALDDNPYSDLMPGDMSPSRLVNRKRAKQIPTEELHHNNLELLQHFITPTGQIRNRVQTRLGARDQRRIARLIKRGRALGLMPYTGQMKIERHGWMHAKDIHEEKDWEKELSRRGLVIKKQTLPSDEK